MSTCWRCGRAGHSGDDCLGAFTTNCLACGDVLDGAVICMKCITCPACGSDFTFTKFASDPMIRRCLNCLQRWETPIKSLPPENPQ